MRVYLGRAQVYIKFCGGFNSVKRVPAKLEVVK